MPKDPETGESYDSPKDALAAALPEGVDAEEVMSKLKDSGYSLESSGEGAGVLAIGIESSEKEEEEESPKTEEVEAEGDAETTAAAGADKELEPGGAPTIGDKETLDISMGMVGQEPLAKRRDKVAGDLMDKFKKGMV